MWGEAKTNLNILHAYKLASRQVVNLDKSKASFCQNVQSNDKQMICDMMDVKAVEA